MVRPGMDLGQDFSDMAYIFLYFFTLLISLLLICYFTQLIFMLCVTFTLHVSIVSIICCKVLYWLLIYSSYLFIFTIAKLNVLLLLCIYSIACTSHFIQCNFV